MMRLGLASLLAVSLFTSACSSVGSMPHGVSTDVSLRGSNYKVIKTGVVGKDTGFRLLGFIPIVSPKYADAKTSLYRSLGESIEGRSVALVNQTQDKSTIYLVLFSIPTLTMTADVVEFADGPAKKSVTQRQ